MRFFSILFLMTVSINIYSFEEGSVYNNDIEIIYRDYGPKDGDPILLVQGLGGQLINWPDHLLEFLIENNIIQVTSTSSTTSSESIPEWIKNTAGWWATDAISESEFVNAMEFLVNVGIISIQSTNNDPLKLLNDLSFLEKTFLPDKKSTHFINSHGFRNIEFSEEKESGVFRIFMIGGSTTYVLVLMIKTQYHIFYKKKSERKELRKFK